MPVARIITRTPQDAEIVAGELRVHGYAVEIVAPGAPRRGGADLEIELEVCDPEDALRRAGELAHSGADIFVTTGTFVIAEAAPAVEPQEQSSGAVEPPIRPVWQSEPESASEHSSLIRDFANVAGPAIAATAHRMRELTAAGTRRARELAFAAIAGGRVLARDAATAIAVRFARLAEQRRHAHQRRQLSVNTQRTVVPSAVPPPKHLHPARLPVIRRTRSRDYEWRTAGMFSVALAIGITVAWAAANRRPATPVPASIIMRSNAMQQQVPFGPVTLPAPARPHEQSAKKLKPPTHKPAITARHRADASENEVVVRHFTPARTQPPSRPAVAVRRIIVND